jgi:hypothetical protein
MALERAAAALGTLIAATINQSMDQSIDQSFNHSMETRSDFENV